MTLFSRFFFLCALLLSSASFAAEELDPLMPDERLNGSTTIEAFEKQIKIAKRSMLKVETGEGKLLAYATCIGTNLVATKYSELPKEYRVRNSKGDTLDILHKFLVKEHDLMLLHLATTKGVKPVVFKPSESLVQGQWLCVGGGKESVLVGVMSANRRSIEQQGGVIGVTLGEGSNKGVKIVKVFPKSPGAAAKLRVGDIINKIGEAAVKDRPSVIDEISGNEPGTKVTMTILRGEESLEIVVTLGHRQSVFSEMNRNLKMSGVTSKRKTGYTDIIQHDIPMPANMMGGPLMDVSGNVLGINISRINRSENFALPSEILLPIIKDIEGRIAEGDFEGAEFAGTKGSKEKKDDTAQKDDADKKADMAKKDDSKKDGAKKDGAKKDLAKESGKDKKSKKFAGMSKEERKAARKAKRKAAAKKKAEAKKKADGGKIKKPEAKKPEPKKPEAKKPEPKKPEPKKESKPEPKKSEPKKDIKPQPKKPEPKKESKPEPKKSEPKTEPTPKPEKKPAPAEKGGPEKPMPKKDSPKRAELFSKADDSKADDSKADDSKADDSKTDDGKVPEVVAAAIKGKVDTKADAKVDLKVVAVDKAFPAGEPIAEKIAEPEEPKKTVTDPSPTGEK